MQPASIPTLIPHPTPGYYLRPGPQGFAAHINASPQNLRAVRALTRDELLGHGIAGDAVDSARLVLSELVGNSVRACGPHVPLVVEVYVTSYGIAVNVHDSDHGVLPTRRAIALDSAEAAWTPDLLPSCRRHSRRSRSHLLSKRVDVRAGCQAIPVPGGDWNP
ncbi:ATP-binding protein [Streptomyces sp. NBC_00343]|uniref:ATP-binding protein n=1 Tax=Streptomyces sp. NBC_00343 TaxID=2975719 RepID=UPI002E2D999B|nr:ATP-binding protein [Streptomyces sp. NBC_00343]